MYEKLKRKTITLNMQTSFIHEPGNVMRFNTQQQTDDIISRLGRSSNAARSVFVPPQQQRIYSNTSKSPTRIPSPVKSIYSVRSHHRRCHINYNNPAAPKL